MANNSVSIICLTPPRNSVEAQPVKPAAISDGVCRADPNAAPIDMSDLGIRVTNSTTPLITNPVQRAITPPRTTPRVGPLRAAAAANPVVPTPWLPNTFGADPVAAAHTAAAPRAEPAMAVDSAHQTDVVVDQSAAIIPQDTLTAGEQRALETAKGLPTSSGDTVLTPSKEGLVTAMEAVLRANPDLVANAAAKGVNQEELRIILANALWPSAIASDGGRFAVPLRTYPGAYAAILDEHLAAKARGDQSGADKAADTGEAVAKTGIEQNIARGDTPAEARRNFADAYVRGVNDDSRYVNDPAVRSQMADPNAAATRFRPWSERSPEEKRAAANGIDRAYRAAGYDPSDEEPLFASESDTGLSMADGEPSGGVYAEVHQAARENARRQERQATANRERTRTVNLQNDRDQGVRIARRRDMDIFAYRGRVVPGTMTAALRDPFRRTL